MWKCSSEKLIICKCFRFQVSGFFDKIIIISNSWRFNYRTTFWNNNFVVTFWCSIQCFSVPGFHSSTVNVNTFHKLVQNSVQIRFLSFLVERRKKKKKYAVPFAGKEHPDCISFSNNNDSWFLVLSTLVSFLITCGNIHIKWKLHPHTIHTLTKLNLLLLIFRLAFYCFWLNICNNAFHSNCNVHYGCKLEPCYLSFYTFSHSKTTYIFFWIFHRMARYSRIYML